jgi:hypothetical protein
MLLIAVTVLTRDLEKKKEKEMMMMVMMVVPHPLCVALRLQPCRPSPMADNHGRNLPRRHIDVYKDN